MGLYTASEGPTLYVFYFIIIFFKPKYLFTLLSFTLILLKGEMNEIDRDIIFFSVKLA